MAEIVLGIATSHTPMISTLPEAWSLHEERDRALPRLLGTDGQWHTYEDLLALAKPRIADELTPMVQQARYDAAQAALAELRSTIEGASPDVVVVIGNDQKELFLDDNIPPFLIYYGETARNLPMKRARDYPKALVDSDWTWYPADNEEEYPVQAELAEHLITQLINSEFDVARSDRLRPGERISHAVSFVCRRLIDGMNIPIVPVLQNTYYPPNQPTVKRCHAFGKSLAAAIGGWNSDARVAVVASGGLSHFVVDEEFDQRCLKGMLDNDLDILYSLPKEKLNSGTSEVKNWITASAAVDHLKMKLVDYIPGYRTLAGTGCAMGFAQWT